MTDKFDQTRKFDADKLRYDLIPVEVEEELTRVLTYGANKYAANSWQKVEPFNDRYYAAARRHLSAWRKGETIDPESGLRHLSHALCNIAFLLSKEIAEREPVNPMFDSEALQDAKTALVGATKEGCPYCFGKGYHEGFCEVGKAIRKIDKCLEVGE